MPQEVEKRTTRGREVEDRQSCLSSGKSTRRSDLRSVSKTYGVPIADDTFATRRHLPHLEKRDATYFDTFATVNRLYLSPDARTIALRCCLHDHQLTYWLHVAVVMTDHVHMIFTPYEEWRLSKIMKRVKGNASRQINVLLGRRGELWQDESFDLIVRQSEDLTKKCEYVAMNPCEPDSVTIRMITRGCGANGSRDARSKRGQAGLPVLH